MSVILLLGAVLLVAAVGFLMTRGGSGSGPDQTISDNPDWNFPMKPDTVYKQTNGNFAFRTPPGEPLAPNTHVGEQVEWVLVTTKSADNSARPATISWEQDTLQLQTKSMTVKIPNSKAETPPGASRPFVFESRVGKTLDEV